jgi:hypothetical protein
LNVRLSSLRKLATIVCLTSISSAQASACSCAGPHGRNAWEIAKLEAARSVVIFAGTPERFDLHWHLLRAKAGERISAEEGGSKHDNWPGMLITFRVTTSYKGTLGPEIQIRTGLGGGDCGAVYAPGLTYLVFAYGPSASDLGTGMCSPGGWIGSNFVATELRYLRKERPIASDLAPIRRWDSKEDVAQEGQRQRDSEEFRKRLTASTGKICGTVFTEKEADGNLGVISILSTTGYSPAQHPMTYIHPDGSFCSDPLGPGKYYLYFTRVSETGPTSAMFYPGVTDRINATTIEVRAGQTQSGVAFKVPMQKTYGVRGIISTDDKSDLNAGGPRVYIALINIDSLAYLAAYRQPIDFQGSFPLPRTKYFSFDHVLPGRYLIYVIGPGSFTKKEDVIVTTHMKFISLELLRDKQR